MNAIIGLFIVQIVTLIIFAPIKLGVKYHFSLTREIGIVIIKVFGMNMVRIKLENKDNKLAISINGRPYALGQKKKKEDEKDKNSIIEKIPNIFSYLKTEKIIAGFYIFAYIGDNDVKNCALKTALISTIFNFFAGFMPFLSRKNRKSKVYPDFDNNRLDFDFFTKIKVNIYQILTFISIMHKTKKVKEME